MDQSDVVRTPAGIGRSLTTASSRVDLGVSLLIAHKAGSAEVHKLRERTSDLEGVENVTGNQRGASAAAVRVVDLRQTKQTVEGVTLHRFRSLKSQKLLGFVQNRVLDGHLRNVSQVDTITPLLENNRNLRDGHGLADGRSAFSKRLIRERNAVETGRRPSRSTTFRQGLRVAELVGDKLTTRQREGLFSNKGFNVRGKLTTGIRRHNLFPSYYADARSLERDISQFLSQGLPPASTCGDIPAR